jgi:hypothetical protein
MNFLCLLSIFLGATALASQTDDLWAKAIFLQADPALTEKADFNANDGRHFEAALRSAHPPLVGHSQEEVRASERRRAPIYVTYGDFCFGPDAARNTRALRYYIAAALRDPDCIEAWYRISLNGVVDTAVRDKALKACMRLQPDNALHFYSIAIHFWEKGDFARALDCIKKGNVHRVSMMLPLVPDSFELEVPMAAYFCYLGIEGQVVTREFLASLATGFQAADLQFIRKSRAMVAELTKSGEAANLEICAQMGLGLILNAERDVVFSSVGFGLVRTVSTGLEAHYAASGQEQKAAALKTVMEAAPAYMERMRPVLMGYEELPTPASRLQNMELVRINGRRTTGVADAFLQAHGVTSTSRLD